MLVSVIIPCFNAEKHIERCVKSVYDQSYKNLEVICIDNNSKDNTWNCLNALKKSYPDIKLLRELKAGANAARNAGLKIANGEWIQFLDSDDLLLVKKIEHQVKIASKVPDDVAYIAGAWKNVYKSGEKVSLVPDRIRDIAPFFNESGNTCSNFWRKKDLESIGNWDETIYSSQETELMLRLILNGKHFEVDNLALTIVNHHDLDRISNKPKTETLKQYLDIRVNFLKSVDEKKYNLSERERAECSDYMINTAIALSKFNMNEAYSYFKIITENKWRSEGKYGIIYIKRILIRILGFKFFCKLTKVTS